jgi:hypothetical protein
MPTDLRTELAFRVDTYFFNGSDIATRRMFPTQWEAFAAASRDLKSMERRYAGYKKSFTVVYPTVGGVPGAIILKIENETT